MVEAKNKADTLIYSTEKTLKEHGDKVDAQTRSSIENAISDLKEASKGDDVDAINKKMEALTTASHKLAEAMYASATQEATGGATGDASGAGDTGDTGESSSKDENVVDAEFEEVKGDKS